MRHHFSAIGHKVGRAETCDCGRLFRCGIAGAYYLHRSFFYVGEVVAESYTHIMSNVQGIIILMEICTYILVFYVEFCLDFGLKDSVHEEI